MRQDIVGGRKKTAIKAARHCERKRKMAEKAARHCGMEKNTGQNTVSGRKD